MSKPDRHSTRVEAIALIEDLKHLRDVLQREVISRPEIRSLCAVLRKLLIDRTLTTVAAPRIGKFHFNAPDLRRSNEPNLVAVVPAVAPFERNMRSMPPSSRLPARQKLDGFLSQRVLMYQGTWATRKNIIDYVAYVASGIHPSRPAGQAGKMQTDVERMLDFVHRHSRVSRTGFQLLMRANDASPPDPDFTYNENEIDVVLYDLLSTIYCVVHSDDTTRLIDSIRAETAVVTIPARPGTL